jgi:hypothetical protein
MTLELQQAGGSMWIRCAFGCATVAGMLQAHAMCLPCLFHALVPSFAQIRRFSGHIIVCPTTPCAYAVAAGFRCRLGLGDPCFAGWGRLWGGGGSAVLHCRACGSVQCGCMCLCWHVCSVTAVLPGLLPMHNYPLLLY